MKQVISYLPNRQYPCLTVVRKDGIYGFENCKNRQVELDSNRQEHAQSIRNMWKLVTKDMVNSSMSIWVVGERKTHELFYKNGFMCRASGKESVAWVIGARPISSHHLFCCIDNEISMDKARSIISMDERELKAWMRADWSHYIRA